MAFDPKAFLADSEAPPAVDAPTEPFDPLRFIGAGDVLGVARMPAPPSPEAVARDGGPKDQLPGAYTLGRPDLTAFRAARSGLTPEAATQVLDASRQSGLGPQFAADVAPDLARRREQEQLAAGFAGAPTVADYAGQSAVHASAVKDDIGPLSWLEKYITGKWELSTYAGPFGVLPIPVPQVVRAPEWAASLGDAERDAKTAILGAKAVLSEQMSVKDEAAIRDLQLEAAAREAEKKAEGMVAKALHFPLRAAGFIGGGAAAGLAGGAVAGPAGAGVAVFGFNFSQNVGPLYLQLRDLQDDLGAPVLSDSDARLYAWLGADAASALMEAPALAFLQRLPGVKQAIGKAAAEGVSQALVNPSLAQQLAKFGAEAGTHALAGAFLMAAQSGANAATIELAKPDGDIMNVWRATSEAFVDGLVGTMALAGVSALGAKPRPVAREPGTHADVYVQHLALAGRISEARRDSALLGSMLEAAKASKLIERSPAEARDLLAKIGDRSVHVDQEAWNKQFGDAAERIHADIAQDEGKGYAAAQAAGTPLEVPLADHLTRLAKDGHAEALLKDSKLNPEGLTPREATMREALTPAEARTLYGEQPQDAQQGLPGTIAADLPAEAKAQLNATEAGATKNERSPTPKPFVETMPPEVRQALEFQLHKEAVKAAAAGILDERPIGSISPARYESAAMRSREKALKLAAEAATEAATAARSGMMAAGLTRDSGGDLGAETLKSAAQQTRTADNKLAKMRELRSQQLLADELAAQAGKLREKLDKAYDRLAGNYSDEYRATFGKADKAYLDAYDGLMEAIGVPGAAAARDSAGIAGALAKMTADAVPVAFDAGAVQDILNSPRPWNSLTPVEARAVGDAVKNLRAAAIAAVEVQIGDRRTSVRETVAGIQAGLDAQHVPDSGPPTPSRAGQGKAEAAGSTLGKLAAETLQPHEILRRLGPRGRELYDAFVAARNHKEQLQRDVSDVLFKAYEQMPAGLKKIRFTEVEGPGSSVLNDNKWVRQDLWTLAMWMGSASGAERALGGLKITEAQAMRALSQLSAKEVDFINSLFKLNDQHLWPLLEAHQTKVAGVAPEKIQARPYELRTADGELRTVDGGYWPAKYRRDINAPPAPDAGEGLAGYWGGLRDGFEGIFKGFTKERAQHYEAVPELNWSAYAGHVNSVVHYLAFDPFVRSVGRVFKDGEFRQTVQRRLGPQEMLELDKFTTVAARGTVEAATDGASNWSRVIGNGLRSRVATAAFSLNPVIVLGQLSHLPAAMFGLRISPTDMLVGLGKALTPGGYAVAHAESSQLPYRWNGYGTHMREMFAGIGPGEHSPVRQWINTAGWLLFHTMDGFLSRTIYEAGKSKALRAGAEDAAAIKAGDEALAIMPPMNLAEQSSLARDRGMIGAMVLVRNFPNTLLNVAAMNAWQARTGIWQANPGTQRAMAVLGGSATAGIAALGMALSAHVFGRFLMGHGREDDETTGEWLSREALAAPFYPVPFLSDVANAIAPSIVTEKTLKQSLLHGHHDIAAAPALAMLSTSLRDLGTALDENADQPARAFAALKLSATAARLPVYPLRPARYAYDLLNGNVSPRGPLDVAGGFLYGQRDKQARNPFTTAQDFLSGN